MLDLWPRLLDKQQEIGNSLVSSIGVVPISHAHPADHRGSGLHRQSHRSGVAWSLPPAGGAGMIFPNGPPKSACAGWPISGLAADAGDSAGGDRGGHRDPAALARGLGRQAVPIDAVIHSRRPQARGGIWWADPLRYWDVNGLRHPAACLMAMAERLPHDREFSRQRPPL